MDLRTTGSRPHDRDIAYKPSHRLGMSRAAELDPPCPLHDVIADAGRTQGAADRQIELTELSLRSLRLRSLSVDDPRAHRRTHRVAHPRPPRRHGREVRRRRRAPRARFRPSGRAAARQRRPRTRGPRFWPRPILPDPHEVAKNSFGAVLRTFLLAERWVTSFEASQYRIHTPFAATYSSRNSGRHWTRSMAGRCCRCTPTSRQGPHPPADSGHSAHTATRQLRRKVLLSR
jgi:hypothetical protein